MTIDTQEVSKKVEVKPCSWEEHRRIQIWFNVPPWKCPCGFVLHGRVEQCVRCKTPRPADYKKGNPTQPGNDFNPWKVTDD